MHVLKELYFTSLKIEWLFLYLATCRSLYEVHLSEASSLSEDGGSWTDVDGSSNTSGLLDHDDDLGSPNLPETQKGLREKLRDCAVKHINHVTQSFLNDLLAILRAEGHDDLPKTAETLLRTQRTRNRIQPMQSKKGTYGTYMYIGIETGLRSRIAHSGYQELEIKLLVNIDGLPIYAHSKQQLWPILIQVMTNDYYCLPFIVALYCGDSKPDSIDRFLDDFINESALLTEQGIVIDNIRFSVRIEAFVCDTPARAFIKCCKAHTAFYACERCEVRGKTMNQKRVYSNINMRRRTKQSFAEKHQPQHHTSDTTTPLLRIVDFDPVRGVVLDYMHLLCCGVMKSLLEKWLSKKKIKGKIGHRQRLTLSELLISMSDYIPSEFQRKVFDVADIANWKATQHRFILLYASGIIFDEVLSSEMYNHFLLFFVACRILCSSTWALIYTDLAESCLRDFFREMPKFYGKESQIMNFHNLIHLADDVRFLQAPLTAYSAFPFENCLGNIKKLIRTPRNPVAQIFRRLSEKESISQPMKKYDTISNRILHISIADQVVRPAVKEYRKITIKAMTIGTEPPDHIVKLQNGRIFQITRIFCDTNDLNNIKIEGFNMKIKGDAFEKPLPSSKVGVFKIGSIRGSKKTHSIQVIAEKCLMLKVETRTYALTLLHL